MQQRLRERLRSIIGERYGIDNLRINLEQPPQVAMGDYATPVAMAQQLHESIPNSTLTVIPGARHTTPVECPREIAAFLGDLLGKSAAASAD